MLNRPISKLARALAAVWLICACVPLYAADNAAPTPVVAQPYVPASEAQGGSPDDTQARQNRINALTDDLNYRYAVEQHDCYSTFFVNRCLEKARDAMRTERGAIRSQQLTLDDEIRAQRAAERNQNAAIKAAQDSADAPQRAVNEQANQKQFDDKQQQAALSAAQRDAEASQREQNAPSQAQQDAEMQRKLDAARQQGVIDAQQRVSNQAAYAQKQADYQAKLKQAQDNATADAQQRADNAQKFTEKQQAAAQHKADVEQRQKAAADKQQGR